MVLEICTSGATIVSSAHGYGIYFRKEDTFYFVELQADNDRAAEVQWKPPEKEVIVEKGGHYRGRIPAAVPRRGHSGRTTA